MTEVKYTFVGDLIIIKDFNEAIENLRHYIDNYINNNLSQPNKDYTSLLMSCDTMQSYTTSNNYSIPNEYISDYLLNLKDFIADLKNDIYFSTELNDLLKHLWKVSLPLLQVMLPKHLNKTQNGHVSDLQSDIEDIARNELENFKLQVNNTQNDILKRLHAESSSSVSLIQKQQSASIAAFDDKMNNALNEMRERIDAEIVEFEEKNETMTALLEKVGLARDAEVTIIQADKELKSATWLRWTGLAFMCGSIILLIYFFRYYIGFTEVPQGVVLPELKDLGFEFFALRFMTVILVSSPAIYTRST